MKNVWLLGLVALVAFSCKNKEKEETAVEVEEEVVIEEVEDTNSPKLEETCYIFDDSKSKVTMKINSVQDSIQADLSYSLDGKDKNTGTFAGTLEDDKLLGVYTFMSEGMESTREVAFILKDSILLEGYGPLDETGTSFVNKDSIQYTSKMPLTKTTCP